MRSFTRLFTATMLIAPWTLFGTPASAQAPSAPSVSRPIITAAPDALNLEYRTGKAPAAVHTGQAELIIVLDGVGTITTGGTLVDAVSGANGNISGKDITGGTPQHLVKGDMLLVPQGTAHMMVPDAAAPFVLATLHVPRTGEPALVAGRAPASPNILHRSIEGFYPEARPPSPMRGGVGRESLTIPLAERGGIPACLVRFVRERRGTGT